MIVRCIGKDISFLSSEAARTRILSWTDSAGCYSDLNIGQVFSVQAVENLDDGLFFYLHTLEESEHPYPYAAEFFQLLDTSFPRSWETSVDGDGQGGLKRITFSEWAKDDVFYEKLVDGEQQSVETYIKKRAR